MSDSEMKVPDTVTITVPGEAMNTALSTDNKKADQLRHWGDEEEESEERYICKLCLVNALTTFVLCLSMVWMIIGTVRFIVQYRGTGFMPSVVVTTILSSVLADTLCPKFTLHEVLLFMRINITAFGAYLQIDYLVRFAFGGRGFPGVDDKAFWTAGFILLVIFSLIPVVHSYLFFGKYMIATWGFIATLTLLSYLMCREADSCLPLQYTELGLGVTAVLVSGVILVLLAIFFGRWITCTSIMDSDVPYQIIGVLAYFGFGFGCIFMIVYFINIVETRVAVYCGGGCSVFQTWGPIAVSLLIAGIIYSLGVCTQNRKILIQRTFQI